MHGFGKLFVIAVAAAGTGLTGCGGGSDGAAARQVSLAATGSDTTPSIAVAGHGKVEGTPDMVTVTMGVETRDPSAQAALERNSLRAAALIEALKASGVAAEDIQTSDLSVAPTWDDKGNITGYSASNTVTARLRDITKAGSVIDAAASKVGDDIRLQGVMFSIDDTSDLVARARAEAVEDALAQGRQLADAAGVQLGPIRTIDSTGGTPPVPLYYQGEVATQALRAAVPLEPGTQQLTVDVTVVFDIGS